VIGLALLGYGVSGLIVLGIAANTLAAPIAQLDAITASVEAQRTAALQSIESASEMVDQTGAAVRGMDQSLADAKAATDRSSSIALGVAASMNQLADAMTLTLFGVQPLIGLEPGFSSSATQLALLATDLSTIGQALDSNRQDALTVAASLDQLATSLDALKTAVSAGPELGGIGASLDSFRMGVLALVVWLAILAIGSILAGLGCWWYAGQV